MGRMESSWPRPRTACSKAILDGHGQDTERSTVLDIARGAPWPAKYPGRSLGHPFLEQWRGREAELAADDEAKCAYQQAVASGEFPPQPVWASEALDLINDIQPSADLVEALATQAEAALTRAGRHRQSPSGTT